MEVLAHFYRAFVFNGALRIPPRRASSAQLPATAEQRQVMGIYVETEAQAQEILASLNAGGDFATLASEKSLESISKNNQGDLGPGKTGGCLGQSGNRLCQDGNAVAGSCAEDARRGGIRRAPLKTKAR